MTISRRMRYAGRVARMGEIRNVYKMSVGKPEGYRLLERSRCRSEDNIKIELREIVCEGVEWIHLAQGRE
jgi:hypothetical protein